MYIPHPDHTVTDQGEGEGIYHPGVESHHYKMVALFTVPFSSVQLSVMLHCACCVGGLVEKKDGSGEVFQVLAPHTKIHGEQRRLDWVIVSYITICNNIMINIS